MKNMGKHRKFCAAVAVMTAVVLLWCGIASADSGTWGSLTWKVYQYALTINGSGPIEDFPTDNGNQAWRTNSSTFESITSVSLDSGITRVGARALNRFKKLEQLTLPASVTSIGDYAIANNPILTTVSAPGVVSLDLGAFYNCPVLKNVTLSKRLQSIGEQSFYECRGLESITIPASVTSVGKKAFYGCSSLQDVQFLGNISGLGDYVFANCYSLTDFTVPEGVQTIGAYWFQNCTNLKSLTIPTSVTSIYSTAFDGIYSIENVYYAGSEDDWKNITGYEILQVRAQNKIFGVESKYNVSFDANGHGTVPDPVTDVASGTKIAAPADPSEDYWVFTGWYKEEDCINEWDFDNDEVTGNTIIYAGWERTPEVTFNANGHGTAPDPVYPKTVNSTVSAPQDPSAEGWNFLGWYKEPACQNLWDFGNDTVSGNITLYAGWTNKCTVTLDDQFNEPVIEFLNFGTLYPYPKAPVDPKNEYKFTRWMIDEGGESVPKEWDPEQGNYEIKGNVVIFADWEPYCTAFCLDVVEQPSGQHMAGGKVYFSEDVNRTDPLPYADWWGVYAYYDPLTFVAVPDEGYGFLGWYEGEAVSDNPPRLEPKMDKLLTTSASFTVTPTKGKDDSIGVCAVFVKQYTITFTDASGKTLQTVKVNPGDVPKYTGATPTKAPDSQYAYTFAGWDPEIGAATGDTTYKAKFTAKKIDEAKVYAVKVTVSGSRGGTAKASVKSGVSGTTVKLTATPAKGYWFKEWKVVSGGVSITSNKFKIGKADVQIQAVFKAQTNIAKAKVTVADQVYTGSKLKPAVTVKLGTVKLKKGTDYTVVYKKNTEIGKATVTIIGAGKYKGTVTANFKINPKPVKLSKLTPTKTELKVEWKKGSKITGYEIEYSLNKDFSKSRKVDVKGMKTVSTVIKNLKQGKTYYVRIRTYKTVGGKKYYSEWSALMKKKMKGTAANVSDSESNETFRK